MTAWAGRWRQAGHLARRFAGALSKRPPTTGDEAWAAQFLLPGESTLWKRLSNADKRHSIAVARRFAEEMGESSRDDMAAVLLHDVGKIVSGLGTPSRVVATIVGPRTQRFRQYHDHESLGAELVREVGSSAETAALLAGTSGRREVIAALRRADHV